MKHAALALAVLLVSIPVRAENVLPEILPEEAPLAEPGGSLFEEGAKRFFRGLLSEMEPALEDMARGMDEFVENVEPMLRDLARMMGSVSEYHAPEMQPNGDIIIRKKRPGEVGPEAGPEFGPGGETEI